MTNQSCFNRLVAGALVAILPISLTSCAMPGLVAAQGQALESIGRSGAGAQKQNKFMADQDKTVGQGTAAGAITGGAAAMLLARRLGPLGQLAVVAGGTIIGNQVGQAAAKKKAGDMTVDANLDSAIRDAAAANRTAKKNVSKLSSQLASLKQKAARARSKGDTNELKKIKEEAKALQDNVLAQGKQMDSQISTQNSLVKKMGTQNSKYSEVSSGVTSLKQSRSQLESTRREVASLYNTL